MKFRFYLALFFMVMGPAAQAAPEFKTIDIEGWQVNLEQTILDQHPDWALRIQAILKDRLVEIKQLLPGKRVEELERVPIYILLNTANGLACYASGGGENADPSLTGGVIFGAPSFLKKMRHVPSSLLHELTHAYHNQVLGLKDPDILHAYQHAVSSHLYENVRDWAGRRHPKSYALTDAQEYFALLTQAYFERSGYFPFTRDQLKDYDPQGLETARAKWEDRDGPQPSLSIESSVPDVSCSTLRSLKSTRGTERSILNIRNRSDKSLSLLWVNYKGERKQYGEIPSRGFKSRPTYAAKIWEIDDDSGRCLGIFQMGTLGEFVEIN